MPTLSVLWKVRKETFSYQKNEFRNANLTLAFLLLIIPSAVVFALLVITTVFNSVIMYFLNGDTKLEGAIIITCAVSISIFLLLTYGAYFLRDFSHTDLKYSDKILVSSQLERIKRSLSILGLEAFADEENKIQVIDKSTREVSKHVSISFENNSNWVLEFLKIDSSAELDSFLEGFYLDGVNVTEICSKQGNPFSSIKFYTVKKALVFSAFKMFNRNKELNGYGSLVLRRAPLKGLKACVDLNLSSEKAEFLIKHKVSISNYNLAQDIPVAWLAKTYNINTTTSNPQNVTV